MRYTFIILSTLFFIICFPTFSQKNTPKSGTPAQLNKLKNVNDSLQYVLGAYIGRFLISNGFYTINGPQFQAGIQDVFGNKPRLVPDSLQFPFLQAYQKALVGQKGKLLENELFNSLKDKAGIGKLPSGVQYTVIKAAKGLRPQETDSVVIHFKGSLPDGSVFENTFLKNIPISTTPSTLIPGLNEVLQMMSVGATWQIFIPAAQAYGDKGNGNIPPNSALMITVELLEVKRGK